MNKKTHIYLIIAILAICIIEQCITYTAQPQYGITRHDSSEHNNSSLINDESLRLELPAINKGDTVKSYKVNVNGLDKVTYTVCYDAVHKQPFWVAYELTDTELIGIATRKGKSFRVDNSVPWPQADNNDYRGSGWSRGHLAPAADFKWSDEAMDNTFYFTNCCPQIAYFNQTSWEKLENRVRGWARQFETIYIVTGPIIGDQINGSIGYNQIPIPDAFFKAVLTKKHDSYQAIGFIMENSNSRQPYTKCCVTIDQLESITGLDLFHNLDDSIENAVESSYNTHFWGI